MTLDINEEHVLAAEGNAGTAVYVSFGIEPSAHTGSPKHLDGPPFEHAGTDA